jgi:thioredoxin 1
MLSVILDEAKDELPDELTIVKVNVDEAKEIAAEYDIQSLPTMILLRGQEKLSSKAGFISKSALVQWICETVNS